MSSLIRINTDKVLDIANVMSGLNEDLQNTLTETQKTVNDLYEIWKGEASEATREAINQFANDYFQNYKDLIDSYIEFLRKNVAEGYEETENLNTSLAEAFK